jgi:hypothetical protein
MSIQNPNSCGQGTDPFHINHPLSVIVRSFGYVYSHSTPITALDGTRYISHTYKHGEHNVSLSERTPDIWETSTSCASGRSWVGKGATELIAHLKSKKRRYNLAS